MDPDDKKLVIFDFDGVLVNTLDFSFAIHKELNKDLTWKKFQDFSNGNFHDGMDKALKEDAYVIPNKWDEYYDNNIINLTISDILNKTVKILSSNYILTIVSSSGSQSIKKFLKKERINKYFSDIFGTDIHKSKIFKINSLLKKYNILPENAVFITDSLGDILEGNECGINSIAVTWGIHSKDNLNKGHPIAIIDDPRDLLNSIKNVVK